MAYFKTMSYTIMIMTCYDKILQECPSKPELLHCLAVPSGTEVSLLCVDNGATAGACSDRQTVSSGESGHRQ